MREPPKSSPLVSRKLEISLKQVRWDEAEELVGREPRALEALVTQLLKDYLYNHHRVKHSLNFGVPPPREED